MEQVTTTTLRSQAAAALREQIYTGQLADGAELRQEELAARLGVSRLPVREALQQLQAEGLLVRLPNRHVRVVGMTAARLRQNFAALAALEGELARLAAPALRGAALPDPAQDDALHAALADALDNPTLSRLLANQRQALAAAAWAVCPPDAALLTALNTAIAAALAAGQDPAPAVRRYYDVLAEHTVKGLAL